MSRNANLASKINFSVYSVYFIPPMTARKDNSSLSNHSLKRWLNFCRVSHRLSTVYKWPGNYFWFWRAGETHPYVTPLGRRLGKVLTLQLHPHCHSVLLKTAWGPGWDSGQSSVEAFFLLWGQTPCCSTVIYSTASVPLCSGNNPVFLTTMDGECHVPMWMCTFP